MVHLNAVASSEDGQTSVEYALALLLVIGIVVAFAAGLLGLLDDVPGLVADAFP